MRILCPAVLRESEFSNKRILVMYKAPTSDVHIASARQKATQNICLNLKINLSGVVRYRLIIYK
jgi:ribosomal protein L34E